MLMLVRKACLNPPVILAKRLKVHPFSCLLYAVLSVYCSLVITCWGMATSWLSCVGVLWCFLEFLIIDKTKWLFMVNCKQPKIVKMAIDSQLLIAKIKLKHQTYNI